MQLIISVVYLQCFFFLAVSFSQTTKLCGDQFKFKDSRCIGYYRHSDISRIAISKTGLTMTGNEVEKQSSIFQRMFRSVRSAIQFVNPFKDETNSPKTIKTEENQRTNNKNSLRSKVALFFRRRLLNVWDRKPRNWATAIPEETGVVNMKSSYAAQGVPPKNSKRKNGILGFLVTITPIQTLRTLPRLLSGQNVPNLDHNDDSKLRVLTKRNRLRRSDSNSEISIFSKGLSAGSGLFNSIQSAGSNLLVRIFSRANSSDLDSDDNNREISRFKTALRPPDLEIDNLNLQQMLELYEVITTSFVYFNKAHYIVFFPTGSGNKCQEKQW